MASASAQSLERIGCELIAEALRAGRAVRVRVTGSSMLPALRPRDTIAVLPFDQTNAGTGAGAMPSRGQMVVFMREGRLFAHRVVGLEADRERAGDSRLRVTTRGDALANSDPPLETAEILGSVSAIHRGGREIAVRDKGPSRKERAVSFAMRHSELARRAAVKFHSLLL